MSIENFNSPVSDNISKIIDEKGYKQCAIAEKAGYTSQMLNAMLKGRKIMKSSDVVRLKLALNVTYDELFKEKEGENVGNS